MEVIYNDVLYNTKTQNELENVLYMNFTNGTKEQFNQCVSWYQSYISGLVQVLNNHQSTPKVLIRELISCAECALAHVEFMLYPKGGRCYAYIHNLSIVRHPSSFPLVSV